MKVLLISNGFQPNYEKAFANGLARNSVTVELIGSDRTPADIESSVKVLNLRGSQNPSRSKLRKALNLFRYLVRLYGHIFFRKSDAVHLNGMLLGGVGTLAIVECLAYRLVSRKLLLTVHNILPHDKQAKTNRFLLRRLYSVPHLLVAHTEKMKRALIEEYGVAPKRIVVMNHGVDEIPEKIAIPASDKTLRVLLFGGVQPYKGVDIFLQSLVLCNDLPISAKIVGEARNQRYAEEIKELIRAVRGPHQVEWVQGFVPENQVQAYFESADAVVLPYRHIDQSGVLFTALRFGVPVIAFDVGAFREYLPEFAGLITSPKTPEALADSLRQFYARRVEYSRDAIREFARTYAWESTVRSLIPHYVN